MVLSDLKLQEVNEVESAQPLLGIFTWYLTSTLLPDIC